MTQPIVTGIDHVQLACPAGSENALRGFWVGVLGMTELPKPPDLAVRGGAWFTSGTAVVHCGVEADFTPARKAHPALTVTDVDVVAGRLAEAGLPVTWDESIPGLRRFHTTDPVGNRVELQQG